MTRGRKNPTAVISVTMTVAKPTRLMSVVACALYRTTNTRSSTLLRLFLLLPILLLIIKPDLKRLLLIRIGRQIESRTFVLFWNRLGTYVEETVGSFTDRMIALSRV